MNEHARTEVALDESPFLKGLVQQIRAHDTFGAWEGRSDPQILEPFVLDKEKLRSIPIIGDPDPETLWRVEVFYSAVAAEIEVRSGIIVSPMMKIHHEGFGRLILMAGRLIVLNRNLRDVHRFGFSSLESLSTEAEKHVVRAIEMIERFREVAQWS